MRSHLAAIVAFFSATLCSCSHERNVTRVEKYSAIRERAALSLNQRTSREKVQLVEIVGNPESFPSIDAGEVFLARFHFANGDSLKLYFNRSFPGIPRLKAGSDWFIDANDSGEIVGVHPAQAELNAEELRPYGLDRPVEKQAEPKAE